MKEEKDKDKKVYIQRYRKLWEDDPRFQGWLQPFPGDVTKARCKICDASMQSHMKSLMGHSAGKKHLTKMAMHGTSQQHIDPKMEDCETVNEHDFNNVSEVEQSPSYVLETLYPPMSSKKTQKLFTCTRTDSHRHQTSKYTNPNCGICDAQPEDELDIFGKSIVAQMRTLPDEYVVTLTSEIQNLVSQKRLKAMVDKNSQVMASRVISVSLESPQYPMPSDQPSTSYEVP